MVPNCGQNKAKYVSDRSQHNQHKTEVALGHQKSNFSL